MGGRSPSGVSGPGGAAGGERAGGCGGAGGGLSVLLGVGGGSRRVPSGTPSGGCGSGGGGTHGQGCARVRRAFDRARHEMSMRGGRREHVGQAWARATHTRLCQARASAHPPRHMHDLAQVFAHACARDLV